MENVATSPAEHVAVSEADTVRALASELVFHSHPDGIACPSAADMIAQEGFGVPFVIQPIGKAGPEDPFPFGTSLPPEPLTGRAFRHGVFDCYTVIRDWYRVVRNVELPVIPRDWEWWLRGENLYDSGWSAAGFSGVAVEAVRPGDCLLFQIKSKVPNHAALVLPGGLILHHIAGMVPVDTTRLSSREPIQKWLRFAVRGLRHASSDAA